MRSSASTWTARTASTSTRRSPRSRILATSSIGTGQVFDGADDGRWSYYRASRAAFPDQRNEIRSLRHADDAVIVEFDLLGTHLGEFLGVPASGKEFRAPMAAIFEFDDDHITCERIYFDAGTILRQLGIT